MKDPAAQALVDRVRSDLIAAIKTRNQLEVSTLKSLLASFSNAEAVDATTIQAGLTEVARNELSLVDLENIILDEIKELQTVVSRLGNNKAYKTELETRQSLLSRYLAHR